MLLMSLGEILIRRSEANAVGGQSISIESSKSSNEWNLPCGRKAFPVPRNSSIGMYQRGAFMV